MEEYVANIEDETLTNENFRKVLFTGPFSQLVVMSLKPNEDTGEEMHESVDQFIRIEEGEGAAVLNDDRYEIGEGFAIIVPAGMRHNIINTSEDNPLKFYSIYSPPEHPDGTVHTTKEEAMAE